MEIIEKWKKTRCAILLNQIIEQHINLIRFLAIKNQTKHIPWEDLLGVGVLGFIKGLDKFCISYGTKFSSYIFFWIQSSINSYKNSIKKINEYFNSNKKFHLYTIHNNYYEDDFVLENLSPLEKEILTNQFIFKYSLREIAKILNFSHEHIRRIKNQAIVKIQSLLNNN